MSKLLVLNPFTLDADSHSLAHSFFHGEDEVSLTVQADAERSDINFIVGQFIRTGELPYGVAVPEYTDYSDIPNDYQRALEYINDSDNTFMEFPATVRSRFDNNPALFLDFVSNPANRDEAINLGFISPPVSPEPPVQDDAGGSKDDSPR